MKKITNELIEFYKTNLFHEEKSISTIEKYIRDITAFKIWLGERMLDKKAVLEYKAYLCENYKPSSVNSFISSLNSFFAFANRQDCHIKALKIQRQVFAKSNKELTCTEYKKILSVARLKKNERLYLVMQTICSTGIRVSELRFITADAVVTGVAEINCKGKIRQVFLPEQLCKMLSQYINNRKIKSGSVFVSRNGKPLDRSNIWTDMKRLCESSGVSKGKVFPHNLRHLFARTYYSREMDVVRLADILGHSSVNTTRIYTMETGEIHKKQIENLGLLM